MLPPSEYLMDSGGQRTRARNYSQDIFTGPTTVPHRIYGPPKRNIGWWIDFFSVAAPVMANVGNVQFGILKDRNTFLTASQNLNGVQIVDAKSFQAGVLIPILGGGIAQVQDGTNTINSIVQPKIDPIELIYPEAVFIAVPTANAGSIFVVNFSYLEKNFQA